MISSRTVVIIMMAAFCECATPSEDAGLFDKLQELKDEFTPCTRNDADLFQCLKSKSILLLGRASRLNDVPLIGGALILTKDAPINDSTQLPATERELEANLPREADKRHQRLDALLMEGLSSFLTSRTIKLKVPDEAFAKVQENMEEYRGKKNKMMGMVMMMAIMMKSMMIPMALGALALLAGKALIVSMLALTLSGVVALKKLASGGDSGSSYEVINVPANHMHHGRSDDAQDLAYRAHVSQ